MSRRCVAYAALAAVTDAAGSACATLDQGQSKTWMGGFQINMAVKSFQPFEHVTIEFAKPEEPGVR